jgi:hypothetical protein
VSRHHGDVVPSHHYVYIERGPAMAVDTTDIYGLILNPTSKFTKKSADFKRFARIIQDELEDLTAQIADPTSNYVTIDGKKVDKTTSTGQLLIQNKLSEIENLNTQNFNLIAFVRKIEDSLRQILG